ncbi:hypothetical protein KUTeg_005656 [Tegillarca granosa]|uniref:C-type lectin domain-containing protein n=1 Tax=Tegillarca granosa TaxID=220873 RepID=A0ABQ9FKB0_TEGGR|nr:hypothetical protein KUTeg_005656 [Tegillarca granosa]
MAQRTGNIWIDGNDAAREGTWLYWTGEPLGFSDWYPGQPNHRDADCLEMYRSFDYRWDDYACSGRRFFICESRY